MKSNGGELSFCIPNRGFHPERVDYMQKLAEKTRAELGDELNSVNTDRKKHCRAQCLPKAKP